MSKKEQPDNIPPPHPSKFAQSRQAWIVFGVTSAFCILLVALLFSLSDRQSPKQLEEQSQFVIDLLEAPSESTAETVDASSPELGVSLSSGGWIKKTDRLGNLSQQYRCTSLDPAPANLPKGWIEMTDPDVELFLSPSRVVRISGQSAIANAPKQTLESGDIYGNVRIELFEGEGINTTIDTPSVVMTTPQASFDNFLGEVSCDSEVRIVSEDGSYLAGRKLSIRFNDTNGRIEYLRLEEVDRIELYQQLATTQVPIHKSRQSTAQPFSKKHQVSASAIENNEQYYLLTLSDKVFIHQGDSLTGKEGRGDRMTIAFALESTSPRTANYQAQKARNSFLGPTATIVASMLGAHSDSPTKHISPNPPSVKEPVVITCEDGLIMLPIDDATMMPSLPEETRFEIFGNPARLVDHGSNMSARGDMVRYEVNQDRMDIFGSPSTDAIVTMNDATTHANHLWIAQKTGEGKIVGEGSLEKQTESGVKTTISWQDGVDFTMTPMTNEREGGILEQVVCNGEIVMTTDQSNLTCDVLDIRFAPDGEGSSQAKLAIATGNVKGTSDTQVLWADAAEVSFIEGVSDTNESTDSLGGSLQADKMTATGDVQVLLSDGGRAFCNTLRGDINQSIAELEGNVLIAYKTMLMDRGDEALFRINRSTGKGFWEGSGQARFLTQPLTVNEDQRITRPTIRVDSPETIDDPNAQHVSMRTTWQESMEIDQHFNDDAGLVDFRGNVIAKSRQSVNELSEIHSESLQLEFINEPSTNSEVEERDRHLQRIIARNNATFEHRLWNSKKPGQLPVVYYIAGNHIEYETDSSELQAVGDGQLVIRDDRVPPPSSPKSSIAGQGTTRFTWDGNLKTTRISDSIYRIKMNDNVEMLHKALDGTMGMLTAQTINALSRNRNPIVKPNNESVAMNNMDVQQIEAKGEVYVATTTRRVDCDLFDYNLQTGLAKLSAIDGRTVAIVTEGTPYPVRATSILWNMDPGIDRITIKGLQASSSN